eukprot:IDg6334t1
MPASTDALPQEFSDGPNVQSYRGAQWIGFCGWNRVFLTDPFLSNEMRAKAGRSDDEPEERRIHKFLTWRDLHVGWPTSATSTMKSGWFDVFEYPFRQSPYCCDIVGVSETRSFREARGEFETRVRSEKESKEAEKRERLAAIAIRCTPQIYEVVPIGSVQTQGEEDIKVLSKASQGPKPIEEDRRLGNIPKEAATSGLTSMKEPYKIATVPEVKVTSIAASVDASQRDPLKGIRIAAQDIARTSLTRSVGVQRGSAGDLEANVFKEDPQELYKLSKSPLRVSALGVTRPDLDEEVVSPLEMQHFPATMS